MNFIYLPLLHTETFSLLLDLLPPRLSPSTLLCHAQSQLELLLGQPLDPGPSPSPSRAHLAASPAMSIPEPAPGASFR